MAINIPLKLTGKAEIEALYGEHKQIWSAIVADPRCKDIAIDPEQGYEFFKDLVLRWPDDRVAYEIIGTDSLKRRYWELAYCVEYVTAELSEQGIAKGDTLAFINLNGFDLMVHVLAAMNLGCIYSSLFITQSNDYQWFLLKRRLSTIEPKAIMVSKLAERPLFYREVGQLNCLLLESVDIDQITLDAQAKEQPILPLVSALYQAKQPVCIRFDCDASDSCLPVTLTAQDLMQSLLLNGLYVMDLSPDDMLITSELTAARYQCDMMLSTFLLGSRYVELAKPRDGKWDFRILQDLKWYRFFRLFGTAKQNVVLILTPFLRDKLIANRTNIKTCKRFLVLEDDDKTKQWESFNKRCSSAFEPNQASLIWQPSIAGFSALVFSDRKINKQDTTPLPGREFKLLDATTKTESLNGFGLCAYPLYGGEQYLNPFGLIENEKGYGYFTAQRVIRNGRVYPQDDIQHYLNSATIDELYLSYGFLPDSYVKKNQLKLLVFWCQKVPFKDETQKAQRLNTIVTKTQARLQQALNDAFGDKSLPDETSYFYYLPRGERDARVNWINSQYSLNKLETKSQSVIYNLLSDYRYLLVNRGQ